MERPHLRGRAIRGQILDVESVAPDFSALHPGYETWQSGAQHAASLRAPMDMLLRKT